MAGKRKNSGVTSTEGRTKGPASNDLLRREVALLRSIIRISGETQNCATEEEVTRLCLKVSEELTGSAFGFMGELNEEGRFDTTTLSESGWNACAVPRPEADILLRSMPNRGINRIGLTEQKAWIVNDPESHPAAVEKPPGHPPVRSFLGVPLRFVGGITGMIGLANKENGYSSAEREVMEALAIAIAEAINRRRAEKKMRELNDELEKRLEQIESANKELEAFTYSVSHDLRAPLRHISGFVELLHKRDHSGLDEKSRHYLEVISESARKMGDLIDDLLAFSRISRTEIKKTGVDMDSLVTLVIDELMEDEETREISWDISPLPKVQADPALLRLVMVNLVANALKFTRPRKLARIEIGSVTDDPDEFRFYVRDNGVGFDIKYVDKLFGLFQRLHGSEEFEGTGIGLANVRRIISRHGGRTWAEGTVDGGAVVCFSLPRTVEE